jgi:hypothetical protein
MADAYYQQQQHQDADHGDEVWLRKFASERLPRTRCGTQPEGKTEDEEST